MNLRSPRIAVALLGALIAVSCSAEPEPRVAAPSATATATASATASASASVTPTVAPVVEAESPEEYIRRWIALEVSAQNTGDTSAYRAATPRCPTCKQAAKVIEGYYAAGGYVRIDGQAITKLERVESIPGTRVFLVSIDPAPTEYAEQAGGPIMRLRGDSAVLKATLVPDGNGWTLDDYTQLAE